MAESLKQELEFLIPKLVALGEDEKELMLWLSIFDYMRSPEQKELLENLRADLEEQFKIL